MHLFKRHSKALQKSSRSTTAPRKRTSLRDGNNTVWLLPCQTAARFSHVRGRAVSFERMADASTLTYNAKATSPQLPLGDVERRQSLLPSWKAEGRGGFLARTFPRPTSLLTDRTSSRPSSTRRITWAGTPFWQMAYSRWV